MDQVCMWEGCRWTVPVRQFFLQSLNAIWKRASGPATDFFFEWVWFQLKWKQVFWGYSSQWESVSLSSLHGWNQRLTYKWNFCVISLRTLFICPILVNASQKRFLCFLIVYSQPLKMAWNQHLGGAMEYSSRTPTLDQSLKLVEDTLLL